MSISDERVKDLLVEISEEKNAVGIPESAVKSFTKRTEHLFFPVSDKDERQRLDTVEIVQ